MQLWIHNYLNWEIWRFISGQLYLNRFELYRILKFKMNRMQKHLFFLEYEHIPSGTLHNGKSNVCQFYLQEYWLDSRCWGRDIFDFFVSFLFLLYFLLCDITVILIYYDAWVGFPFLVIHQFSDIIHMKSSFICKLFLWYILFRTWFA